MSLPHIGLAALWAASWPVTVHLAAKRHRSSGWALVTAILFGWLAPLLYRWLPPRSVPPAARRSS